MENRLILVEGIPGAGKTTTARKLRDQLISQGKDVILYEEGMLHPADMAWHAYLTEEEYETFVSDCLKMYESSDRSISEEELMKRIEKQVRREDDHIILAYTRIDFPDHAYWKLTDVLASREIFDGRCSLDEFTAIHLKRWTRFKEEALKSDQTYIFECAFLQNHIFELLAIHEKNSDEIYAHLRRLLNTVKELNPSMVYVEPSSVKDAIDHVADERRSPDDPDQDWIRQIALWVSRSPYGRNRGLVGIEGVYAFCEDRLSMDKLMIERLGIPVTVLKRNVGSENEK